MPRTQRSRKVCTPPKMLGFRPYGLKKCKKKSIVLNYDEFEGLKYINYDKLSQDAAAEKMGISRPTFTRLHNSALNKIAKAFVECLIIEIEGGNVVFERDWYKCGICFKLIDGIENHQKCKNCNSFGDNELVNINQSKKK
jgi:uncharacterized protein